MFQDISLERGMPASPDAERSILGAVLLNQRHLIEAIAAKLEPEDFSLDSHRRIYRRMLELDRRQQPIDLVTLVEDLAKKKEVDSVGGAAYVASLTEGLPRRVSIAEYVRIVKDKSLARQSIVLLNSALTAAVDQGEDDAMDTLTRTIADLRELASGSSLDGMESAGDYFRRTYTPIDRFFGPTARPQGLRTGIRELDSIIRLRPADLIIIGARPSQGKTALLCNIAWDIATTQAKRVGIFSLEQNKDDLIRRIVAQAASVPFREIESVERSFVTQDRLNQAISDILDAKIWIDDERDTTPEQMIAKAESIFDSDGLDALFVDYLGYIPSKRRRDERRDQELGRFTKAFRACAKRLRIPVIVLSQLSRPTKTQSIPRPQLSDLRESGEIEQDADVVVFIHREEMYGRTDDNANLAELDVAKQRNGPTGIAHCRYEGSIFKFLDK
jgi:replicative DNA helicase